MFVKNKNLEVGDIAITTKKLRNAAGFMTAGTKVRIIGITERGYDLEDGEFNQIKETGWDSVAPLESMQYTISPAYSGNSKIQYYINGIPTESIILNDYDVEGHCSSIHRLGYKRAYDVDEAKAEVERLKQELEEAESWYKYCICNPLIKANKKESK